MITILKCEFYLIEESVETSNTWFKETRKLEIEIKEKIRNKNVKHC